MKIETSNKKFAGQSMRLGNKEFTLDKDGKFEVEKELGAELIEKYDFLFEEGKLPKVIEQKVSDTADLETINDLTIKIEQHKATIEKKNKEIALLKEDNKNWREIAEKALKGEKSETLTSKEIEKIEPEGDFKAILGTKTFDELKALHKDMGGSNQSLRTPEQVIEKILELEEKE